MGPISKKLGRRSAKWSSQVRRSAQTVHIPKDVRDVGTLVKDGYDPLHAVYISVQNITSVFSECVSVLPELEPYYDVVAAAEDEYMPSGPPMSPLTGNGVLAEQWRSLEHVGQEIEWIDQELVLLGHRRDSRAFTAHALDFSTSDQPCHRPADQENVEKKQGLPKSTKGIRRA